MNANSSNPLWNSSAAFLVNMVFRQIRKKSVRDAPRPTDKRQVKSILGMVNYVQRYIPGLASLVKPFRELTRKNSLFEWTSECDK